MNTKTYYISKSLGAFRKIGINEGIIERAIKGIENRLRLLKRNPHVKQRALVQPS